MEVHIGLASPNQEELSDIFPNIPSFSFNRSGILARQKSIQEFEVLGFEGIILLLDPPELIEILTGSDHLVVDFNQRVNILWKEIVYEDWVCVIWNPNTRKDILWVLSGRDCFEKNF